MRTPDSKSTILILTNVYYMGYPFLSLLVPALKKISKDFSVIEGYFIGQIIFGKNSRFCRIIRPQRGAISLCYVYRGDSMLTWIAIRIGIRMELPLYGHLKACLFFSFSNCSLLKRFAIVYKTTRNCPPVRGILPFDQYDTPILDLYENPEFIFWIDTE